MKFGLIILFIYPLLLNAQYNFTSGFGELKGPGGNASQSVGQISYTTISAETGTVNQGVIQPYKITVLSGEDIKEIELVLNVFPNPVLQDLTLKVENMPHEEITYFLYDIGGRLLTSSLVRDTNTIISTADLIPATYFLQIRDKKELLKIFKIVKI